MCASSLIKKQDSDDFTDLYDTVKLLKGIKRHKGLIAACTVLFALLGAYFSYLFQNTYKAEALVIYQEEEDISKTIKGGFTLINLSLPTVLDLIVLPKHYEAIKKILGLDLSPAKIKAMTSIPKPKNSSNLISIVAKAKNPTLSQDIANTLAKVAVKSSQEFIKKQLKLALFGYQAQLEGLKKTLEKQMSAIENFKLKHQYFDMNTDDITFLNQAEEIRKEKEKAKLSYDSLVAEYKKLQEELTEIPKFISATLQSKDSPLQRRIISLKTAFAEAKAKYTEGNPKLIQLQQELKELYQKNKNAKNSEEGEFYEKNPLREKLELERVQLLAKAKSAETVYKEVLKDYEAVQKQLSTFPVQQMEFVKLLSNRELTLKQLANISNALQAAQVMMTVPQGNIELYQLAKEASPWKDAPWVKWIPLMGSLFGLSLGLAGSYLLEINDKKIRTAKQIHMFYRLACLGVIPKIRGLNKKNASYKILFFIRNLAERLDREKKLAKIISLTSSVKNEGKSLIAKHLFDYYSLTGQSTLLLTSETSKLASLEDYLEGAISYKELTQVDRMTICKRGETMKELLKTERAKKLWSQLKESYEKVIIDTPGVIEQDYAVNLSEIADATIVIVGSSIVKKSIVDETLQVLDLAGVNFAGILLNKVDPVYITDKRVLIEMKKKRDHFFKRLFTVR